LLTRARWLFWTGFYRLLGRFVLGRMGEGCWFEGWVDVPAMGGEIRLGRRVRLCRNVELTAIRGARVVVGDGAFIGRGVVVSAHAEVEIGARTLVAEYACIHDNDHAVESLRDGAMPAFVSTPLRVGNDCWIGAHAVLVRSSGMGDRCVLGAGAVLTSILAPGTTAAGVPARAIRAGGLPT
jgi:acetyltransferase-like isoleucine patch superfamily enzyme